MFGKDCGGSMRRGKKRPNELGNYLTTSHPGRVVRISAGPRLVDSSTEKKRPINWATTDSHVTRADSSGTRVVCGWPIRARDPLIIERTEEPEESGNDRIWLMEPRFQILISYILYFLYSLAPKSLSMRFISVLSSSIQDISAHR